MEPHQYKLYDKLIRVSKFGLKSKTSQYYLKVSQYIMKVLHQRAIFTCTGRKDTQLIGGKQSLKRRVRNETVSTDLT